MVGTSHHYTADNIRALVAEYKALESGAPEAVERYSNSDHRTRAGVLWRVISALADEVPFAPPMDGGDAGRLERERICAAIKAEDDYCVDHGDYMLDSDDCIKIVRGEWVRDALSEKGGR